MPQAKIQVFLFTYNRPDYVQKTVDSIFAQDYDDFELIISDNSTDNRTKDVYEQYDHPKLTYIQRVPSVTPEEHFNTICSEIASEYVVFFHDDDIMLPTYLSETIKVLENDPAIAAAGSNGFFIYGDEYSNDIFIKRQNDEAVKIFDNPSVLANVYLRRDPIAPFPSYMYRSRFLEGIHMDAKKNGLYSDAIFILEIMRHGGLAWVMTPQIYYRLHHGQLSKMADIQDYLKFLRYLYINVAITRNSPETIFFNRIGWCIWLKYSWKETLKKHPRRYFKVFRIMLPYLLQNKKQQILNLFRKRK